MANPEIHFVISAPRSGSTWLTSALNHHPEIFATEHRLFGRFAEIWKNNNGTSSPRITFDSYAAAFGGHYFHEPMGLNHKEFVEQFQKSFVEFLVGFAQKQSGKRVVIDKITPYPGTARFVVRQIRSLFPESKIIQLVRDGRDVLVSGTFDWLMKDADGTDRHAYYVEQREGFELTRFLDDAVIRKWADNWTETIDAFNKVSADCRVTYEAMTDDQPAELQRIFASLDVDDSDQVANICARETTFEKMTGRSSGNGEPLAKARKGVVGDWRNHFTQADGVLFQELAGRQLRSLGYVANANWIAELPDQLG